MARSDYDIINLSLEHELNEWLAERGYAGLADNRNVDAKGASSDRTASGNIPAGTVCPGFRENCKQVREQSQSDQTDGVPGRAAPRRIATENVRTGGVSRSAFSSSSASVLRIKENASLTVPAPDHLPSWSDTSRF